jgi:hypothetical protein
MRRPSAGEAGSRAYLMASPRWRVVGEELGMVFFLALRRALGRGKAAHARMVFRWIPPIL